MEGIKTVVPSIQFSLQQLNQFDKKKKSCGRRSFTTNRLFNLNKLVSYQLNYVKNSRLQV